MCVVQAGPEPAQEAGEAARRGCFPARLVEWLVAVSWNRGAHHARFLRWVGVQCGVIWCDVAWCGVVLLPCAQ